MRIKINFLQNGKDRGWGFFRSLFDFFFWSSLPQKVQRWFRKYRGRFESGTYGIKEIGRPFKVLLREFGTFRAFFWTCFYLAERSVEEFFRRLFILGEVLVFEPQLEFIGGIKSPIGYLFAIALDNSTNSGNKENVDPWTWSHTSTGSSLTMVMNAGWWSNSGTISSPTVTYNSVGLTKSQEQVDNSAAMYYATLWYKTNPSTGANTASVDFSSNSYGKAGVQTFSGTNTASPVDTSGKVQGANGLSVSKTVTTNNANSFLVDCMDGANMTATPVPDGSQTANWTQATRGIGSSRKATTTAGNYTMSWSWASGNAGAALCVIAINELPAVGPAQLKSWNGLAKASMKTINGLAIGSVKSWDGLG